jgi:hypothetical protein
MKPFASGSRVPLFVDINTVFQKGDSILILITHPMRDLGRHRENHNFSLLSLTPITFDLNTFSCYGGSYFATIAVSSYTCRRPLNLAGLSMPTKSVILLTTVTAYYSEYVQPHNCLLPLSRLPPRALQLSTSTLHPSFLSYMTRAWGMPASFVHSLFFIHTLWKVGFYKFPSPSNGALLTIPLLLSLTIEFSVEETLMDFGYTYAPNLIHQGASIVTEISSANGYKNSTSSNSYEDIHGSELTQKHS